MSPDGKNKMLSEEIVVSGIAGRFPNSNNMKEYEYNLYNKVDMVDDDESRWPHYHAELPNRTGKIRNLEKFDMNFFTMLRRNANFIDPQVRILLEHSYEAIIDAGISPQSMVGSRTGVFVGCCLGDARETHLYQKTVKDGMGVAGNAMSFVANRVSFLLGLNGPSLTLDTACSSSAYALDVAFKYIQSGACDSAIVAGTQLNLNPQTAIEYSRFGILAKDGYCRPFDENAHGFCRSDTICAMFLQKSKDAKRVYADLVYTKTSNDGFKKEGFSFPSKDRQQKLMEEFYGDLKLDTNLIGYIEGHTTGTVVGDPQETNAIDAALCKSRETPLLIGSVKSNIGHAEAASAVASIAKVILSFENQKIPPNINFTSIRKDIPALVEGRMKVVSEVEELKADYVALNSFGLAGANAHALFKGNSKKKINFGKPEDDLERLLLWSGRTEEAIDSIFNDITTRPLDAEYIGLLQNSQLHTSYANICRAFGVFKQNHETGKATCETRETQMFDGVKRPIVWVFSGVGSQWCEMGKDLMRLPTFANAINNCHDILMKQNFDLKNILFSSNENIFKETLNTFVGIAAIQIGLTDVLKAIGLEPDFIIGHSVGELGCAYADGCFTAEEMILSAYSRGMACKETKEFNGGMAAVGMTYDELKKVLPNDIDIACHNSSYSFTVAGPAASIKAFVEDLTAKKIFAREVASSGMPFHSRYMAEVGPLLLNKLSEFITHPKKRTSKWLSTSVPQSKWEQTECQYSSAQYHTNNLLNPVLFNEGIELLPKDALTIEIAPHGLFKSVLKRSIKEGIHVSLANKGSANGTNVLLESLGKIFQNGVDMDIGKLYPEVHFPVSQGTPMISSLIKWDHSEDYNVPYFDTFNFNDKRNIILNMSDKNYEYIEGHVIDGKVIFPGTGYILLVWETFGMMMGTHHSNLKVVIDDIKFMRATSMTPNQDIDVTISIAKGSGRFEVTEGKSAIASGYIKLAENLKLSDIDRQLTSDIKLNEDDFYKEMRLRGYHHHKEFRAVTEATADGLHGKVKWTSNWTTFTDCLLQLQIINLDTRNMILPTSIRKLCIDPKLHKSILDQAENGIIDVNYCPYMKIIQAGGVEMHGFEGNAVNRRRPPSDPILESYRFTSHFNTSPISKLAMSKFCIQLMLENIETKKVCSVEIDANDAKEPLSTYIYQAMNDQPIITIEANYLTSSNIELDNVSVRNEALSTITNSTIIIKSNCMNDESFLSTVEATVADSCFILSRESEKASEVALTEGFKHVATISLKNEKIFVIQYRKEDSKSSYEVVKVSSSSFEWIENLKTAIKNGPTLIVSENEKFSGILGLMNCIRREYIGANVKCFFIDDSSAPNFDINSSFYKSQLDLGLSVNVFKNGSWGTYKHFALEADKSLQPKDDYCFANYLIRGDLNSLSWMSPTYRELAKIEDINVQYASLNFRDVMLASGRLLPNPNLDRLQEQVVMGFEFSGITAAGRRVVGLVDSGAFATKLQAEGNWLWDVPDSWSLEDAATVPLVYCTVYAAFFLAAKVKRGDSVLIHAGSGGVGIAAQHVAFAYGLEVFTTVSTEEKKAFLLKEFPKLKPENIGNSRDLSFEKMIMIQTKGKGVNHVLNSLSEDKLQASLRCLAKNGIFLEIGKFDIMVKNTINLDHFARNISFKPVYLEDVLKDSAEDSMTLRAFIINDMKNGIIKPLKTTIYDAKDMEQAFRFLASGKHIGKVLLKVRENETDVSSLPISVVARTISNPEFSYVILGGLGGFGVELADWLVLRGCKKIVMSSRRGISSAYQSYRIRSWENYGVKVLVDSSDVTTFEGCKQLLDNANKLGPVGGIYNLAVVLRDAIFDNQDEKAFIECLKPKANATIFLDELSRKHCPNLHHFVIFSSVSCGRGNAGQTNYGMANSIMERIVEERCKVGLPAKAIQWGAIGEVGLVAEATKNNLEIEFGGTMQQRISSCLEVLDVFLNSNEPIVSSMVIAQKRSGDSKQGGLIETILSIMGIRNAKPAMLDSPLGKLGIDSLIAVEVLQILEREYDLIVSPDDLRNLSLNQLKAMASKDSADSDNSKPSNDKVIDVDVLLRHFADETKSNDIIVQLNDVTESNSDEKILIIPGVSEPMAGTIWYNLAEELNLPTFVLQTLKAFSAENIDDLYEQVINDVLRFYKNDKSFVIVGYSFGSLLGLKIAHKLESLGKTGKLILIDGSPLYIFSMAMRILPQSFTDNDIQSIVIYNLAKRVFGQNFINVVKEILVLDSWNAKIDKLIEFGKDKSNYNPEFAKKNSTAMFNGFRMLASVDKNAFASLQSTSIELIRASTTIVEDITEDFGLNQYTTKQINVQVMEGDHSTVLSNPDLAAFLNSVY